MISSSLLTSFNVGGGEGFSPYVLSVMVTPAASSQNRQSINHSMLFSLQGLKNFYLIFK
jgi:hypothetical protein